MRVGENSLRNRKLRVTCGIARRYATSAPLTQRVWRLISSLTTIGLGLYVARFGSAQDFTVLYIYSRTQGYSSIRMLILYQTYPSVGPPPVSARVPSLLFGSMTGGFMPKHVARKEFKTWCSIEFLEALKSRVFSTFASLLLNRHTPCDTDWREYLKLMNVNQTTNALAMSYSFIVTHPLSLVGSV